MTWGHPRRGGTAPRLEGPSIRQLVAAESAFAAVLDDGAVVAWGAEEAGGDSSEVQEQLKNVQELLADKQYCPDIVWGSSWQACMWNF